MEMRNILLLASALTLLPIGASAQFYTVTQGKEFFPQYESKMPLIAENKRDTAIVLNETLSKDTLTHRNTEEAADRQHVQKSNGKSYLDEKKNASVEKELSVEHPSIGKPAAKAKATAKPADTADCNLPALTIPNLYAEIKRNGILYPTSYWRKPSSILAGFTPTLAERNTTSSALQIRALASITSSTTGRIASRLIIQRYNTAIRAATTYCG